MRATSRRTAIGFLLAGAASAALPASAHSTPATGAAADPTDGWQQTTFTYSFHKPWNLDLSDRYSNSGGVHKMWVYATDEPMTEGSTTDPRTEMRWKQEYTTGSHMWDADVYIPSGTDGATFAQILRGIHPEGTPATDIMLNAYEGNGGTMRRYDGTVLRTGIYNTWINVKIAHQASTGTGSIKVYLDNSLVMTVADRGPATRYFKNGVYNHGSGRAEARFRNIKYWTR